MKYFVSTWRNTWLVLLLLGIITVQGAWAQAPAWQTAIATGQTSLFITRAVAANTQGDVFIVGQFSGSVSFSGTTLTSAGNTDGFVARWNPSSNSFSWAQRVGSTGYDAIMGVAVNGTDVIVAGSFNNTIAVGSITLTSAGSADIFVSKLTDAGSFVWAKQAGGPEFDETWAVCIDGTSIYVAGNFRATATFGAISLAGTGPVDDNAYVAKLTNAGLSANFVWAQRVGSPDGSSAKAIATSAGSVYVGGSFFGRAAFGGIHLLASNTDGFIAKIADSGSTSSFVWAQQVGGPNSAYTLALALNGSSLYLAGAFVNTATFGTISLANSGGNYTDAFVAKLTDAGLSSTFLWAQKAGGTDADEASSLVADGSAVYVTGHFAGTASFGSTSLTSTGSSNDIFVAKLLDAGSSTSFAWAQRAGGSGYDVANALAKSGSILYVGGDITGTVSFSAQLIGSGSGTSGFLASLTDATGLATASPIALAGLIISPNPAHALATVQLLPIPGATTATLTLFDALGRAVRTQTAATNTRTELDLTGLSAGFYVLRVQAGSAIATNRLIVE